MSAGPSPAFAASLARISAEALERMNSLCEQAEQARGRRIVTAELVALPTALMDPELSWGVKSARSAAYGAAHGIGNGLVSECFCCRKRWTGPRRPGAVVVIRLSKPAAMLLAFACTHCCNRPIDKLKARIVEAIKRDFIDDEGKEIPLAAFAPGGRA